MIPFFRGFLVGPDSRPDEQALLSIVATFVFLALIVYTVIWLGHEFDAEKFAIGVTGLGAHRGFSAWSNKQEGATSDASTASTPTQGQ